MLLNRVIPTALFSPRDANEQRNRDAQINYQQGMPSEGDWRNYSNSWDRAAEGFRDFDPAGRKLAELIQYT